MNMLTTRKIKNQLRTHAPQPTDNEAFMADTIRQINLLPSPESELQRSLRRYTLIEQLAMRMDAARWILLGGTGSMAVGYVLFMHYEAILSSLLTLLSIL